MSKISDFFAMSKQERTGAWLIVALIIILIAAVFIERKCTTDNVDATTQKQINEYVEKASKTKVTTTKNNKKKKTNKGTNKKGSTKNDKSKQATKSKSKNSNTKKYKTTKKKNTDKTKKKTTSPQRMLEPVPEF